MKQELEVVLQAARTLPTEELPRLLGALRVIESVAQARLLAPPPAQPAATNGSDLLDVKQTARYIGMSCGFVYRNADAMPVIRIGNVIRFRRRDLNEWITQRRATPRSVDCVGNPVVNHASTTLRSSRKEAGHRRRRLERGSD